MKYKFLILIFLLTFCFVSPKQMVIAEEASFDWCRITGDNTFIYKENPSNENNICFQLPTSYFAKILECADDCYKVSFDSVIGYVKKEDVTPVFSKPLMPFPEGVTCQINSSVSAVVFDAPSTNGKQVGIAQNGSSIKYYGSTLGEEAILGLGTNWFYVSFNNEAKTISGFVYAPLTQNLVPIKENTEEVLLTPASAEISDSILSPELMDSKNILIIISLCLTGVLLLLAFVIPRKKKKQVRKVLAPPKFDDFDF